jgi:hypothetical protein
LIDCHLPEQLQRFALLFLNQLIGGNKIEKLLVLKPHRGGQHAKIVVNDNARRVANLMQATKRLIICKPAINGQRA